MTFGVGSESQRKGRGGVIASVRGGPGGTNPVPCARCGEVSGTPCAGALEVPALEKAMNPEKKRVPVPVPSWALPTPMLWEAGERPGSACAIEVEGLKRRPPNVKGWPRPSLGFRVSAFK